MAHPKNKLETFADSFDAGLKNWTIFATAHMGRWETKNGELIYDIAPPYNIARGYISPRNRFQNIHCITMDFFMPEYGTGDIVIWLHSFHYIAAVRITKSGKGNDQVAYLRLNALKHTGIQPLMCKDFTTNDLLKHGDWNSYRLEISAKTFTLYLNGQSVLVYTDPEYPAADPSDIQLKTSVDGMRLRNFSVQAENVLSQQSQQSEPRLQSVYNAKISTEHHRPYGFVESAEGQNWKVTLLNEQPVYGTNAEKEFSQTWLHGFEKDGEIIADVACEEPSPNAVCGIFARFAVEGSYLRAGYDFKEKTWFISASFGKVYRKQYYSSATLPGMQPHKYYKLQLVYNDNTAQLYVNGASALIAEGLENISYGRMGMFAKGTGLYARAFACRLLSGKITDGILEQTIAPDKIHSHFEIERIDKDTLYGQFEDHRYISYDLGVHFVPAPSEYNGTGYGNTYPSIHRRQTDGKFIQVLRNKDFIVQESNDLKNWTTLCRILPKERLFDKEGRRLAFTHISNFTELTMPDGKTRIFLPIGFNNYFDEHTAPGHYTNVFYSDDGGKTWQESEKNVRDLPSFSPWRGGSWCESKIIRCVDGRLRMLCTRNMAPCVYFADSFDNGKTWTSYGELTDMPSPTSSFAVCADPIHPGNYFMLYINEQPFWQVSIFPRTRLTLVRTDGLNYEKVLDIDRFSNLDIPEYGYAQLYQILDPCINVFEDYIFISFGRSNDVGISESCHHGQHVRFVRIDRKKAQI